jgi:hypothetical protein
MFILFPILGNDIFTIFNGLLLILSIFLIIKLSGRWLLLLVVTDFKFVVLALRFPLNDGLFNIVLLALFTLGLYFFKKLECTWGWGLVGGGVVL